MRVIFIPDWSKCNPYQKELANALSNYNVELIFANEFRQIIKFKPHILHIHWQHAFFLYNSKFSMLKTGIKALIKLVILKILGIKFVWTVHNIHSHEEKFKNIEILFSKLLAKMCNYLIVLCFFVKNEIKKYYKIRHFPPIKLIPHGDYINYYNNNIKKNEAKKMIEIEEDFVFLYFGVIREYKGVKDVLTAFKKLNTSNTKLLVVGKIVDSELKNYLMQEKDNNIKFVIDFIPDDDIQIYMNAADVVVLPFKKIWGSGSLILAMSFSKPVIAPKIGCVPEIIDEKGGFLYDPMDKEGLIKCMKEATNKKNELNKMGEYNFNKIKKISWDYVAKLTYEVYQQCLIKK